MMQVVWGKLLDGTDAVIELSDEEALEFGRAESYQRRLVILRGAAFRQRMTDWLLSVDGRLESNVAARPPEPDETVVWLQAGQIYSGLDTYRHAVELGSEAVELFGSPDHSPVSRPGRPRSRKMGPVQRHDQRCGPGP